MHSLNFKSIHSIFDLLIIFAIVIGLSCCRPSHTCHTDHGVPTCDITHSLDSIFINIFPGNEPGGIATVMLDGKIIYNHAFGVMDLSTGEQITDSTLFNLSSASKIFTSVALLKLQEQGMLNLDDSLSKYFPEFKGEFFNNITVRHILTHSSGLPDLRPRNENDWQKYLSSHKSLFVIGDDYRLYGREEEHMKIFQNLEKLEFEPGTHYQRDDASYILVAPLIERVTGMEFDSWMDENIFKPAGMKEAFYYKPDFKMHKMAHAYKKSEGNTDPNTYISADGQWEEYDYGEVPFFLIKADRGIYTSARDFMQWNRALYSGKIISDSSMQAMATPYLKTGIPFVSFGLGSAVSNAPNFPPKIYHLNSNGGFATVEATWPSKRLNYIIFANRSDWDLRKMANAMDSILLSKGYLNN